MAADAHFKNKNFHLKVSSQILQACQPPLLVSLGNPVNIQQCDDWVPQSLTDAPLKPLHWNVYSCFLNHSIQQSSVEMNCKPPVYWLGHLGQLLVPLDCCLGIPVWAAPGYLEISAQCCLNPQIVPPLASLCCWSQIPLVGGSPGSPALPEEGSPARPSPGSGGLPVLGVAPPPEEVQLLWLAVIGFLVGCDKGGRSPGRTAIS